LSLLISSSINTYFSGILTLLWWCSLFPFKQVGKAKQTAQKVIHGLFMKTYIPAGMATSAPPLGTMLGQVNCIPFLSNTRKSSI
jgi:hypothetical protein